MLAGSVWLFGRSGLAQEAPQSPPPPAATISIEERLQKLEETNRQLVKQNQEMDARLRSLAPAATVPSANLPEVVPVAPPASYVPAANMVQTPSSVGGAYGGGDLLSPPEGGPADRSAGTSANDLRDVPSRGASFGGGDLISFAPDDPGDAAGVKMNTRFGRRFTNNGLWFESTDKVFQFHVGGRVQMDSSFFSAGNPVQFGEMGIGPLRDGVAPRRMRIRLEGAMYENMLFCSEFDFVNTSLSQIKSDGNRETSVANTPAIGTPVPTDLWVTFRNIPYLGHIRIGNQKEPMGFERLTSSRFLNFMERSFNNDAFYGPYDNGFVPGIATFSTYLDRRGTYALGIYKNVTNGYAFDVGSANYKVTGRITALPIYENDGRQLVHLGVSGRQAAYNNGLQRFRIRGPERGGLSAVWPNYAYTPIFAGSGGQQDLNLEFASVLGPWTIDAEYNFHWSQNAVVPTKTSLNQLFYSGGYVEVLYFLTGEHRAYVRESGLFDRVIPKKNAYWVKGKKGSANEFGRGAWQVGMRYNYLSLEDAALSGGVLNDLTFGLNWFINPNMKFQANYSVTNRQSPNPLSDGVIQGFGLRYAMDY